MIYSILKTIIETTIVQYDCQSCGKKIDENSLSIGEVKENEIHLNISCPHCQAHAHIHAEVANVHSQIIQTRGNIASQELIPKNANAIKEEDIMTIKATLDGTHSIEDFLK